VLKNNKLETETLPWKGIKGENIPLPVPSRAAFVKAMKNDDDD
jgi:hypothetical protein